MAILIMRSISPFVIGIIPSSDNAKAFLEVIGEKFQESKKAKIESLISQLTQMKYDGEGCVMVHIMNMLIGNKLRTLNVNVDEAIMVDFEINSLPSSFRHLKSTYIAQNEIWTLNDMIGICMHTKTSISKR
ncbi:unnamed protein product [Prunus brigantina]